MLVSAAGVNRRQTDSDAISVAVLPSGRPHQVEKSWERDCNRRNANPRFIIELRFNVVRVHFA
jgi:hypothetical protein